MCFFYLDEVEEAEKETILEDPPDEVDVDEYGDFENAASLRNTLCSYLSMLVEESDEDEDFD